MRKKPDPSILPLAARMFSEGVRVKELCERARPPVAQSTWSRWASGEAPNTATLRRLEVALEELLAEEAADLTIS